MQQKVIDDVAQLLNPNHALLLKAATAIGKQATWQTLLSAPIVLRGNIQHVQNLNQKLLGSTQDIKSDMNGMMRSQAVVSERSFIGFHGSNQGGSNLAPKGWPLAGLDELRSGFLQPNNGMHSSQSFNQLSLQQQLMLQELQNLIFRSASYFESWNIFLIPINDQRLRNNNLIPIQRFPEA